jgi:hypothetical protein
MSWAQSTQRVLATLVAAGVAVQFFLAGAGAFGATSFAPHRALGWTLLLLAGIVFIVSLPARRLIGHSGVLFMVVALQAALGVLGADTEAWFGALHGLNALAVMAASATLARRAWLAS